MDDLNLDLRKDIIEIALTIETAVNQLLISYLNIDKTSTKTLSNKSSSLSFKNKIDLLNDLEVLADDEHGNLNTLMEFRNQFLHNSECNSFSKAINLLGTDKKNKLLKFADFEFKNDEEYLYKNAYKTLFIRCLDIVIHKFETKQSETDERKKMVHDLAKYSAYAINSLFDIYDKAYRDFLPGNIREIETPSNIIVKGTIINSIGSDLNALTASPEFQMLLKNLKLSFTKERTQKYFKV